MKQLKLHQQINILLAGDSSATKPSVATRLIAANMDACQYFYSEADERWLGWLWENGFLDALKEKAGDPTQYGYRTPEISYLVRMAEKDPNQVAKIILDVPVSAETFNPEVIDRFIRICSELPASPLAQVVPKMLKEDWIRLMRSYSHGGFEYKKMFGVLANAKDYENLLLLAETVLRTRSPEEIKAEEGIGSVLSTNPFYFGELRGTEVFEYIMKVDSPHREAAMKIVLKALVGAAHSGEAGEEDGVFTAKATFHLFDVDFFDLELRERDRLTSRDDVRALAATVKLLTTGLFGEACENKVEVQRLYREHFESLPDSRPMWRLRLFVLSLCPKDLKEEIKEALRRLFKNEQYHGILSGAEYLKTLRVTFALLDDTYKRTYIEDTIKYFSEHILKDPDPDWHVTYGSRVLSMIADELTKEEKEEAERKGFTIRASYEPEPSISRTRVGSVNPKGPISQEDFDALSVEDIAQKLRADWSPDKLAEQNSPDEIQNPLNAEGAGKLLQAGIAKRLQEFVDDSRLLFDRDVLDEHYTYDFLRGIQEAIKSDRASASDINWDGLMGMLDTIVESGQKEMFQSEGRKRGGFSVWLADWTAVHLAIADVLQELLTEGDPAIDFSKNKIVILKIISYLLGYPDPTTEDEHPETASATTTRAGEKKSRVSDPYSQAINTVRGRAFQAFAMFVYQDGASFAKEEKIKISSEAKTVYETTLEAEDTRALMFMFGHYLPTFYFRDREWIRGLLPDIFPEDSKKKHLYLAAWEGYLASDLFIDIFKEPEIQKLYGRGLTLASSDDPGRQFFREPEDGISIHFALAYMYYAEFGFGNELFEDFWKRGSAEQHAKFVSFLGRMFVSGDNTQADELMAKDEARENIRKLWDWLLENYKNSEPFVELGFWVNLEKGIFEADWLATHLKDSLDRSEGELEWELGLLRSLSRLIEKSPKDSLEIVRLYLLEGSVRGGKNSTLYHVDEEWLSAFRLLYANPETKTGTYKLIDDLIRDGGSVFWPLKEILDKDEQ